MKIIVIISIALCMNLTISTLSNADDAVTTKQDIRELCAAMSTETQADHIHKSLDDVTHRPATDVNYGAKKKASKTTEKLNIPLTLDVLEGMELNLPEGIEANTDLSNLEIHTDGRVMMNGQDMSPILSSICGDGMSEMLDMIETLDDMNK